MHTIGLASYLDNNFLWLVTEYNVDPLFRNLQKVEARLDKYTLYSSDITQAMAKI